MARYRIYYLKESHRQQFRDAPPRPGLAQLKRKDYEEGGEIEAAAPYVAWQQTRSEGSRRQIEVGDALETDSGALLLCRYAGFEEAQWWRPASPESSLPIPAPEA